MLALSETPDTLSASIPSGLCLYQQAGDNQHDLTQAHRMFIHLNSLHPSRNI